MAYQCSYCNNNVPSFRSCLQGCPDYPRATDCAYFESEYASFAPNEEDLDGNDWE